MSAAPTVDDALAAAGLIARNHRLRIATCQDPAIDEHGRRCYRTAYVVYRVLQGGSSTRLGKRRNPAALLAYVRELAGVSV